MKNILLIIPNMNFGGAQRSFSKLSLMLSEKYNVINVVFNTKVPIAYELGGTVVSLDVLGGTNTFDKMINFVKRIRRLKKLKQKHQIDVSISFLEGADFVNILSKVSDKIILSIRGSKVSDETIKGKIGWLRKKILIPYLYKKADWVTCVNKGIAWELDHYYGLTSVEKTIIYNYYDIEELRQLATEALDEEYGALLEKPYLVFSGRVAVEKGIDKLIRVYSALPNRSHYRFVIVGDGPLKKELITLCSDLGLIWNDRFDRQKIDLADVVFVGAQKNPHKFVAKAQVFLMASSSEGFPNALVEAMACGTPTVSADCPWGPREILAENTETRRLPEKATYGVLMPMLDIGESGSDSIRIWTNMLESLLGDVELLEQYRKMGNERVNDFNKEAHCILWESVIEKVGKNK
jgi:glycosyltransferase involved in cell wall biosynthesis